ncbi:MAG TPA: ribonuclease H-like domain-containing protein [Polyangiaceae bacterium]|nr:ribonuclease H-like domain-containing protein [Polyangiaceae bacterium]
MSLARRLSRLESRPAASSSGAAAEAAQIERSAAGPSLVQRREKLDELRRELDALLERAPLHQQKPRVRQHFAQLPFVRLETNAGPLWQREKRLSASHYVGSVAVAALAQADSNVLAELALDPSIAGSEPASWLFLDTETTGFAGAGTLAFLVGMAWLDGAGEPVVEQLLLAEPDQELPLLERVAERVRAATLIVSFNGKAFDRPLLDGRYLLNGLPPLPSRPHFDLLHVARRLHQTRLGRCSLKRIEMRVLGFDRGGDIDGSEVAALYGHFLRSGDAAGIAQVVSHNLSDVVSMLALVGLYGQRSPQLEAIDLAGLARTLRRAGARHEAERVAEAACQRGAGAEGLRVRAQLAKARGDVVGAIRDLEAVCEERDDPDARLELAKLYEHRLGRPARALEWLEHGTSESTADEARRRARLRRKLAQAREA